MAHEKSNAHEVGSAGSDLLGCAEQKPQGGGESAPSGAANPDLNAGAAASGGANQQAHPGDYSCASCGFGLTEPCEHWKDMLAAPSLKESAEPRCPKCGSMELVLTHYSGFDGVWCKPCNYTYKVTRLQDYAQFFSAPQPSPSVDLSDTPNLAELRGLNSALAELLQDAQPGLAAWHSRFDEVLEKFRPFLRPCPLRHEPEGERNYPATGTALPSPSAPAQTAPDVGPFCHADREGDCEFSFCPQLRDGEPAKSGRHCPLDQYSDVDDSVPAQNASGEEQK